MIKICVLLNAKRLQLGVVIKLQYTYVLISALLILKINLMTVVHRHGYPPWLPMPANNGTSFGAHNNYSSFLDYGFKWANPEIEKEPIVIISLKNGGREKQAPANLDCPRQDVNDKKISTSAAAWSLGWIYMRHWYKNVQTADAHETATSFSNLAFDSFFKKTLLSLRFWTFLVRATRGKSRACSGDGNGRWNRRENLGTGTLFKRRWGGPGNTGGREGGKSVRMQSLSCSTPSSPNNGRRSDFLISWKESISRSFWSPDQILAPVFLLKIISI